MIKLELLRNYIYYPLYISIYGLFYVSIVSIYSRDIKKIIALSTGSQLTLIYISIYYLLNSYRKFVYVKFLNSRHPSNAFVYIIVKIL